MTHMLDLPLELLTTVILLMVKSGGDIRDWARVTAVCKGFYRAAMQPNFLKLVNCEHLLVVTRPEQHHHINGLLSRCVLLGNPTADSVMAKVILFGGVSLWTKIQENDQANSSIKSAITLPLSDRRNVAKSLITGSIADVPYILFSKEDKPRLCKVYERLNPLRLVKSFIRRAGPTDLIYVYPHLNEFIIFLVGYPKYTESGIHGVLEDMYWHQRKIWLYEHLRRICNDISDRVPEVFGNDFLPVSAPKYKGPVILALDKLFEM
ncbi:putative F-box-like domain superfamily protein [Helianthus anomalus]